MGVFYKERGPGGGEDNLCWTEITVRSIPLNRFTALRQEQSFVYIVPEGEKPLTRFPQPPIQCCASH